MEAKSNHTPPRLVRACEIYTHRDKPGLLPISRSCWYRWLKEGRVPAGRRLGAQTVVWPIEQVLALGAVAANDAPSREAA
jgi:predicted DNA-binding transcriptional regulator AlpA